MTKEIEEVKFTKNRKNVYMIIKYNDNSKYSKKLNNYDKDTLFFALTNIMILSKYRR